MLIKRSCRHFHCAPASLSESRSCPCSRSYIQYLKDSLDRSIYEVGLRQRQRLRWLSSAKHTIRFDGLRDQISRRLTLLGEEEMQANRRSALLTYLSGSTFIFGWASLYFMSFLVMLRQFLTASTRLRRLYEATLPLSSEACETNVMLVWGT